MDVLTAPKPYVRFTRGKMVNFTLGMFYRNFFKRSLQPAMETNASRELLPHDANVRS